MTSAGVRHSLPTARQAIPAHQQRVHFVDDLLGVVMGVPVAQFFSVRVRWGFCPNASDLEEVDAQSSAIDQRFVVAAVLHVMGSNAPTGCLDLLDQASALVGRGHGVGRREQRGDITGCQECHMGGEVSHARVAAPRALFYADVCADELRLLHRLHLLLDQCGGCEGDQLDLVEQCLGALIGKAQNA